jgi:hypothetical protein
MHLNHDPIPTVPPRGLFDYTHPSNEVFDPFTFDPAAMNGTTTRDGSTAVFCPGRENEARYHFSFHTWKLNDFVMV